MINESFFKRRTVYATEYSGRIKAKKRTSRSMNSLRYTNLFNKNKNRRVKFRNSWPNHVRVAHKIQRKSNHFIKAHSRIFLSSLGYLDAGSRAINPVGFFFKGLYISNSPFPNLHFSMPNNINFLTKLIYSDLRTVLMGSSLIKPWLTKSKDSFVDYTTSNAYYNSYNPKLLFTLGFDYSNNEAPLIKPSRIVLASLRSRSTFDSRKYLLPINYLSSWNTVSLHRHILNVSGFSSQRVPSIYSINKYYFLSTNIFFPPSSGISTFKNLIIKNDGPISHTKSSSYVPQLYKAAIASRLRYGRWSYITPKLTLTFNNNSSIFSIPGIDRRYSRGIKHVLSFLKSLRRLNKKNFKGLGGPSGGSNADYVYNYDSALIQLSGNKIVSNLFLDASQKFLIKNLSLVYISRLQSSLHVGTSSSLVSSKLNLLDKFSISRPGTNLYGPNDTCLVYSHVLIFFKKFLTPKLFASIPYITKFLFVRGILVGDSYTYFILNKLSTTLGSRNLNLVPSTSFNYKLSKSLVSHNSKFFIKDNFTPWIYNNIIRFMEFCSGKKALIQNYSFLNQSVSMSYTALYKRWMPRLFFYERRLGHRFFLEEALHILHIGFVSRDSKILNSWLAAMIKRISFWKTRLIFRFIRYLFNNYFSHVFSSLGLKGFKVRLKGKISVAGNSRKRSILYRSGTTSHANSSVRVVHTFSNISTFTGALGFQIWLFY